MGRQERAERTRQALVVAAAVEFDRHGFSGTSLSQVSKAAEVTMGALSFHFPSKNDLAAEVCAQGTAATRAVLDRVAAAPRPGLLAAVDLTLALVRLLELDVRPRACARLSRDLAPELPSWNSLWCKDMRELLDRVRPELPSAAAPEGLEPLVRYLMAGAEASIREGRLCGGVADELASVWELLGRGLDLGPLPGPVVRSS
ncbi:TetR family transcriptional regulator [Kitasatospora sp. NBC_01266]|uniref:TetR family transcriptional regulator n=1 Tax=Kitasatospora sp. NBC_01266 TaxID=2903572 RepID=UPI002E2FE7C1|nr:TetR family transcriptional regulator [Kitasatospora sp. NBC_01266]